MYGYEDWDPSATTGRRHDCRGNDPFDFECNRRGDGFPYWIIPFWMGYRSSRARSGGGCLFWFLVLAAVLMVKVAGCPVMGPGRTGAGTASPPPAEEALWNQEEEGGSER